MASPEKLSPKAKFKKLLTDAGNNFIKPLAIIVADPIVGILLYSFSLFLCYKHTQAHIQGMIAKAKVKKQTPPTFAAKMGILAWRMVFDFVGLGLSIAFLILHLAAGFLVTESLKTMMLGTVALSMTLSSIFSTGHKLRRIFKPETTFTKGEIARIGFGVIGTAFLGCVVFGVISAAVLSNPIVLGVGALIIFGMGYFKCKKTYHAYQKYNDYLNTEEQQTQAITESDAPDSPQLDQNQSQNHTINKYTISYNNDSMDKLIRKGDDQTQDQDRSNDLDDTQSKNAVGFS